MNYLQKTTIAFLASATMIPAIYAQEKKEEVIITRKGEGSVTVVINGDKITVNGKPLDEYKDEDIQVKRRKVKDANALIESFGQGSWNTDGFKNFFSTDNNTPYLGVTTEKSDKGVLIESVSDESAANKAGLTAGDIIKKIGDKKITTPDDLSKAVKEYKPGDKVKITYERNSKEQTTTAELGKWKGSNNLTLNIPSLEGFNFQDLNLGQFFQEGNVPRPPTPPSAPIIRGYGFTESGNREKIGLSVQDTDEGVGVKVLEVEAGSTAEKAEIKEGDIILEIDDTKTNAADEAAKVLRQSRNKKSVSVKIKRGTKVSTVEVKIPRNLKTANL